MSYRKDNLLLQRLRSREFSALSSTLIPASLSKSTSLFERNKEHDYVYFPVDAVISFAGNTGRGSTIEVWSVGREGLAGLSSLLGTVNPFPGVVVVPGTVLKGRVSTCRRYFNDGGSFHDAVLSYQNYLLVQVSHLGICNNSHPLVQRLSRWLLIMQERAGTRELKFTQNIIASMLGTRRATISVAAAELQSAGLISYTPGSITIKSIPGLKKLGCDCHKAIRAAVK
jgi:CRP-like cAMP-binding protein